MNPLPVVVSLLGLALAPAGPGTVAPERSGEVSGGASAGASTGVSATAPAGDVAPHGVWPLRPRPAVVHGFDPPANPYGSGHRGVDLLGTAGQPVHAAMAGTVRFAGPLAGVGVVVVDHGTTRTTYQPVLASVSVGQTVAAGAVMGTLSPAGSHCAPAACLHWGWIRDAGPDGPETYLDPLGLVGLLPMRLLPLD